MFSYLNECFYISRFGLSDDHRKIVLYMVLLSQNVQYNFENRFCKHINDIKTNRLTSNKLRFLLLRLHALHGVIQIIYNSPLVHMIHLFTLDFKHSPAFFSKNLIRELVIQRKCGRILGVYDARTG